MPTLVSNLVIARPANSLSPKESDAAGHKTHTAGTLSERYKDWLSHLSPKDYSKLYGKLCAFLQSDDAITTFDKMPDDLGSILRFAHRNGYKFDAQELVDKIDIRKVSKAVGKAESGRCAAEDSALVSLRANLEDQLVASAVTGNFAREFDTVKAIQTLYVVERAAMIEPKLRPKINVSRFYEKPVILNDEIIRYKPAGNVAADSKYNCGCMKNDKPRPNGEKPNCECKPSTECIEQNPYCFPIIPFVSELFTVRDEVVCYKPAEILHIDNRVKGEKSLREHRQLKRDEIYTEREKEDTSYEESTHKSTEASTMKKEVDSLMKERLSLTAGATFSYGGEATPYQFTASTSASKDKAKEEGRRTASEISKEVVKTAVERRESKERSLSTFRQTREIEVKNSHGFGGENGISEDQVSMFLGVTEVRKAKMYSHGLHSLINIELIDPSAMLRALLYNKFEGLKPVAPDISQLDCASLTPENYIAIAGSYGAKDVPDAPEFETSFVVDLEGAPGDPKKKKNKSGSHVFTFGASIPNDYEAFEMRVSSVRLNYNEGGGVSISATMGPDGANVWHQYNNNQFDFTSPLANLTGSQSISVHCWDVTDFNWRLTIKCKISDDAKRAWQNEVCAAIQVAIDAKKEIFEKELDAYEQAKAEHEEAQRELRRSKLNKSNFASMELIKTMLKQQFLNYLTCQFFHDNNAMKPRVAPCGFPQADLQEAEIEGRFFAFLEECFNWKHMNFILRDFFYKNPNIWKSTFQAEEITNPMMQKFFECGTARASVAIRPSCLSAVQYFLATGMIPDPSMTNPLVGDGFIPIDVEMRESRDNFNTDRAGRVIHDTGATPPLAANEICLEGNTDYYADDDNDPLTPEVFTQLLANKDLDREIFINCKQYHILGIREDAGKVIITLDRDFAEKVDHPYKWSTGAILVTEWEYEQGRNLTWLKANSRCLPCYPITCEE